MIDDLLIDYNNFVAMILKEYCFYVLLHFYNNISVSRFWQKIPYKYMAIIDKALSFDARSVFREIEVQQVRGA